MGSGTSSVVIICQLFQTTLSETAGPIRPKFYLWHSWAGGLKVCVFDENWILVWLLWQLRVSIDL